jgi:hypothetical protein
VRTSDTAIAVLTALHAARPHLPEIVKSREVKAGPKQYKYAPLNTFLRELSDALASHGLLLVQSLDLDRLTAPLSWTQTARGEVVATGTDPAAPLLTRVYHVSSGEWVQSEVTCPLHHDSQDGGSALTYSRRYGIQLALGMAPDEDDDGARARRRHKAEPKPAEKAAKAEHDPSWAQARARFCGSLTGQGLAYEDVARWLEAHEQARPSGLTRAGRVALYRDVSRDGSRRVELDEWLARESS